jgi:CRP-like cAMP-binding protein
MQEDIHTYQNQLKNTLLLLGPSPDEEIDQLAGLFREVHISKKTSIIKPGENTDSVYFIIKGLVRIYYVKEQKEITNWFITENRFFAPVYHLFTGQPNPNFYEALEETIAITTPYRDMEKLYRKYHSLEHIGRKLIELYYADFLKQSYDLMFLSAEERYTTFIKKSPELVNRIPLRFIASFLGITQETLSRLRSKH